MYIDVLLLIIIIIITIVITNYNKQIDNIVLICINIKYSIIYYYNNIYICVMFLLAYFSISSPYVQMYNQQ